MENVDAELGHNGDALFFQPGDASARFFSLGRRPDTFRLLFRLFDVLSRGCGCHDNGERRSVKQIYLRSFESRSASVDVD